MNEAQLKIAEYFKLDDLNDFVLKQKSDRVSVLFTSIYDLHAVLGSGSFGIVCKVTHRKSGQIMAIKIAELCEIRPSAAALALQNEYRMLTEQLHHPNIVRVIPADESYFNYFIMQMELG